MGRTVRDARLETRSARLRLPPRAEPYWRTINEGAHLGYYRGTRTTKWVARYRGAGTGSSYIKTTIGETDDTEDPDDVRFLSFRQAQERARAWFEDIECNGRKRGSFTVADALDEYMRGFRGKSVQATRSRIDSIIKPALGHLEVRKLTRKLISDWHIERGHSPAKLRTSRLATEPNTRPADSDEALRRRRATANRDLTVLKAALNRVAESREGLPTEAWRSVKPFPKADGARLRYLSDDEARRLVNACDIAFRPLVQAALLTGGRYGELTRARVRDYDGTAQTLWFPVTKGGCARPVYLESEGVQLLERQTAGKASGDLIFPRPDGNMWGQSQQARPITRAAQVAKVDAVGFHDLRRTYGARLAIRGVPMAVIAEALGHADERITRRHYAHLSPSYVADTVRANVAGFGIVAPDNVERLRA